MGKAKLLTILAIVLYVFVGNVVLAKEKEEKIIPGFKIEYIKDNYGFKVYEISSKNKSVSFNFCVDKLIGFSTKKKLAFFIDIDTRKIVKFIELPKIIFDNIFCNKSGNVLFLTYSPSIVGVSKLYIYDISSGKFLEFFSIKDDRDAIPEPIYFNYGDEEFIITPNKEGFYKISDNTFYLIPYSKIEKLNCGSALHIYKKQNNKIHILSSNGQKICQIDLDLLKTDIVYKAETLSGIQYIDGVFYFFEGEDYYTETVSLYRLSLDKKPKLEHLKKIKWFTEFAGIDKEKVIYGTAEGKIVLIDKNKEILLYKIHPRLGYPFLMEEELCGYCFRVSPYGILFRTEINTVVFYKNNKE